MTMTKFLFDVCVTKDNRLQLSNNDIAYWVTTHGIDTLYADGNPNHFGSFYCEHEHLDDAFKEVGVLTDKLQAILKEIGYDTKIVSRLVVSTRESKSRQAMLDRLEEQKAMLLKVENASIV